LIHYSLDVAAAGLVKSLMLSHQDMQLRAEAVGREQVVTGQMPV